MSYFPTGGRKSCPRVRQGTSVRPVARRVALAAATPSLWPVQRAHLPAPGLTYERCTAERCERVTGTGVAGVVGFVAVAGIAIGVPAYLKYRLRRLGL